MAAVRHRFFVFIILVPLFIFRVLSFVSFRVEPPRNPDYTPVNSMVFRIIPAWDEDEIESSSAKWTVSVSEFKPLQDAVVFQVASVAIGKLDSSDGEIVECGELRGKFWATAPNHDASYSDHLKVLNQRQSVTSPLLKSRCKATLGIALSIYFLASLFRSSLEATRKSGLLPENQRHCIGAQQREEKVSSSIRIPYSPAAS